MVGYEAKNTKDNELDTVSKRALEYFHELPKIINRLLENGLTLEYENGSANIKASDSGLAEILGCAEMPQAKHLKLVDGIRNHFIPYILGILEATERRYTERAINMDSGEEWMKQGEARIMIVKWLSGKPIFFDNMILSKSPEDFS